MSRNQKKKSVLKYLRNCIQHDFGFYNPKWKWSSLPPEIRDNYELIENELKTWEEQGAIKIYVENEERIIEIFEVPNVE